MGYDYDALYRKTKDALGLPTQVFVDFFAAPDLGALRVLDVGCGQGRDAVFIARLGHHVTGVDLAPHGIADLDAVAKAERLYIVGVVADLEAYRPDADYDVILIDRTLHMLEEAQRLDVLARLADHVTQNGWILIADEASNMVGFKAVLNAHRRDWSITLENNGHLFFRSQD